MTLLLILINMATATEYHCMNHMADLPKIKFRGDEHDSTMYKAVKMCVSMRIQQYTSLRLHNPSDERKILFVEDCTNKTYCKIFDKKQEE